MLEIYAVFYFYSSLNLLNVNDVNVTLKFSLFFLAEDTEGRCVKRLFFY